MVDRLTQQGYVDRLTDDADGRVCRVVVTGRAEEMVAEARARKAAWLVEHIGELSEEDRSGLLSAVDALETLADLA